MATSDLIDLRPDQLVIVESILAEHVPECEVRAFGSRATWTAKDYSDLDLAVVGDGPLDWRTISHLKEAFEESPLPMRVDVVDLNSITDSFRESIEVNAVLLKGKEVKREIDRDWRTARWGELATLEYGKSLRGYDKHRDCYKVYGTNGPIGWHSEPLCPYASVIVGRKGAYRGIHYSAEPFFVIDTAFYLKPLVELDTRWAYYQLLTQDINRLDSGSAIPSTSREDFYSLSVKVPSLEEQRAIARVLGTLDDRIELNRRMSETLDEMARALFRSWFVDFDPVRAKSEGRPSGLPPDLDALFPDSFEPSELDDIPAGWRLAALTECIDAVKGLSYKGSGLSTAGIPLHNLNSIYEGGGYKPDGIKFYVGDHRPRHLVESGDVVVANTDLTQKQVLIGSAAIVPSYHGSEGLFSHHLFRVRARDEAGLNSDYICHLLNSQPMQTVTSGYATGTTVNMLPVDALRIPKAVLPPRCLVARFGSISKALRARQDELHIQSCDLVTMRDTLLPRLLSGELRVRGAEQPPAPAPT